MKAFSAQESQVSLTANVMLHLVDMVSSTKAIENEEAQIEDHGHSILIKW